jgi:hypothetical protein
MKRGNVFWGILLLTLGVIFILRNLNIFFFNFHSLFRLWPLIFVFWGIAILPVKAFIKVILSGITILIAVFILAQYPSDEYRWFRWDRHDFGYENKDEDDESNAQQHLYESFDTILTTARLNLDATAGKFYIKNQTSELYELDYEDGIGSYKANTFIDGSAVNLSVKQTEKHFHGRDFKNTVWLALNPYPVWDMNIEAGAAGLELDVSLFKVERIDIKGGASSVEIRLGDRSANTKVNIDAGASAIEIELPESSGCELHTSSVLSSREIEGFEKDRDGLYRTSNFSTAANQVMIDVDVAVSSLKVIRY